MTATAAMRSLVDAGQFATLPGGFKAKGTRIVGDNDPISPGEWKEVEAVGNDLSKLIIPLPYKEPSQVLLTLFNQIVQEGRAFASSGDMKVSDMSNQAPVGTTLAILERTLKVMSAVQSRVYYALDQELKLLADIIKDMGDEGYDIISMDDKRAICVPDHFRSRATSLRIITLTS